MYFYAILAQYRIVYIYSTFLEYIPSLFHIVSKPFSVWAGLQARQKARAWWARASQGLQALRLRGLIIFIH